MIQKVKEYIETQCEETGSDSYTVPKEKTEEFLTLIKGINIIESSHFRPLSYHLAHKHPYYYGKASFLTKDSKVYVQENLSATYIGCNLLDPEFEKLRINAYKDYLQLLFDYQINGSYGEKCLSFGIGETDTNSTVSEKIQLFRVDWNLGKKEEAEKHLFTAEVLSYANDALSNISNISITARKLLKIKNTAVCFPEGSTVYILDKTKFNKTGKINNSQVVIENGKTITLNECDISLKQHPLNYKTLQTVQNAIYAVSIPYLIVNNVYYTKKGNIVVCYKGMNGLEDSEIVRKIYSATLKDILPDSRVHTFTDCREIFERITDGYDVFTCLWMSDLEHLVPVKQNLPEENSEYIPEIEETETTLEEEHTHTETAQPKENEATSAPTLF